jgi:peptidoglycan/LPS O-acetylase OafA/YrhL
VSDRQLSDRVRPDLQALRAVAVVSVVLYHLWPNRLHGGYVGVDVFFAISGFLIIGHLLREVEVTGRVRLVAFWARRARRLIPASIVTLLATGVATLIWVPQAYWAQFLHEIGAAAIYVVNWLLAFNAVDYLGAQNTPSPVQHFWSLSVEEQFYIAWPIVIVLTVLLTRGLTASRRRAVLIGVLAVITAASAVYSVIATAQSPASSYFITPTRAWEFGVGGLLAAAAPLAARVPRTVAAVAGWIGLAAIGVAVLRFSDQTAFPGFAAWLPVGGALLIIAAGPMGARWSLANVARLRPVQWLGDISYSVYLWHWPLIVILPLALGRDLGTVLKVSIIVVSLAIGWLSTRFLEDPIRTSRAVTARGPWFATIGTVVITALVFGGTLIGSTVMQARVVQAQAQLTAEIDQGGSCIGSGAFGPGIDCPNPFAVTILTNPAVAGQDIGKGVLPIDRCKQTIDDPTVVTCDIGDTASPIKHLALVGDSHAGQFLEPLAAYAASHGWLVTTYLKTWCAGTGAVDVAAPDNSSAPSTGSCTTWGADVLSQLAADPDIDAVVFANYTARYDIADLAYGRPVTPDDFLAAWQRLEVAGKQVMVIRDTPNTGGELAPQCVARNLQVYDPCAVPRSLAIPADDPQWAAVQSDPNVIGIDLADRFCDLTTCHSVIGGLIVYFDSHHLTATFARTLAPYLGAAIAADLR